MLQKAIKTLALLVAMTGFAHAQTVLTVVEKTGGETSKVVEFSMEELLALKQYEISTENDYVDGKPTFKGPLMRDVLKGINTEGAEIARLIAVDDYSSQAPVVEAMQYDVILALQKDGAPLSRRGKGPIWVIYPMSDHKELRRPEINGRLVWQLAKIEVAH